MTKFKIDPQFAEYMPQTDAICDAELEKELIDGGGPRDRLLVAELPNEERFLFDGHRRYRICERHGLPYATEVFHFETRSEVFDFMDRLALVRRNLTPQQLSLIRGRQVKRMNGKVSAAVAAVAKEHGVSERSVYRDMEYAEAVDSLEPEVKKGVIDMPKKDAVRLSSKPKDEQSKAMRDAKENQKKKPISVKEGRESEVWRAQQVMKTWIDSIGRWMNGNPCGIDVYREKFPGKRGDEVLEHAKSLLNALEAWKKGLK